MKQVTIVETPIVLDSLSHLRDKTTSSELFRTHADKISYQLLSVTFKATDLQQKEIYTPLKKTLAPFVKNDFVFVTILRAGLSMFPAVVSLVPEVRIGLIGLKRDEQTAIASEYYCNLPMISSDTTVILADPMLATGGSIIHALKKIQSFHPKEVRIVSIISAPEGIEAIRKEFPDVRIITGAIDSHLDAKKYIVPGLGDFGDRYFGTE